MNMISSTWRATWWHSNQSQLRTSATLFLKERLDELKGNARFKLLEASGVDTVKELRNRNADNLLAAMLQVNDKKNLVRRPPSLSMVKRWVAHAKQLPPVVTY